MQASARTKPALSRWLGWGLTGFLLLLTLLALVVWLLRRTIADSAVEDWCAPRGLKCDGDFDEIGPGGLKLSNVTVERGSETPFAAQAIDVQLSWNGPFSARVKAVTLEAPVVRGRLDGGGLTFSGLEDMLPKGGSSGAPPRLDVRNAKLFLNTAYGVVAATAEAKGNFPQSGTVNATLLPSKDTPGAGALVLKGGAVHAEIEKGRVAGTAELALEKALIGALSASGAKLDANFEGPLTDEAAKGWRAAWSGKAESLANQTATLTNTTFSGDAELTQMPKGNADAIFAALARASASIDAEGSDLGEMSAGALKLKADLSRAGDRLTGPVSLDVQKVTGPDASAQSVRATGEAQIQNASKFDFTGEAALGGARLTGAARARVTGLASLPSVIKAHEADLKAALDRAADGFDLDLGVAMKRAGDTLTVASGSDVKLVSRSGLSLALAAPEGTPAIQRGGALEINGRASVSGGGAPALTLENLQMRSEKEAFALATGALKLADWTVDGQTIAADLKALNFARTPEAQTSSAEGAVTFSGKFFGVAFAPTTAALSLNTAQKGSVWSMRAGDVPCADITSAGFVFGSVTAEPFTAKACPPAGVFVKSASAEPQGTLSLGALSIPFNMKAGDGTMALSGAAVNWRAGKEVVLDLTGERLDLPMNIGRRTLNVKSGSPKIDMVSGKGDPKVTLELGPTDFAGTMIPAKVFAGGVTFDGVSGRNGVSGAIAATNMSISDILKDPIYQPLKGEFSGKLTDNQLEMSGPLSLASSGRSIADAHLDLNILTLTGDAQVTSRDLTFKPGGFQPVQLTERLRGVFTSATGQLQASADVDIVNGALAGTADIYVENFGFQTQQLGRVAGINGRVRFSDVFKLTTEKEQLVTVASMNPGIELNDGEIVFDLEGGSVVRAKSVAFPFAGGTIALAPLDWTLGAKTQAVEVSADKLDLTQLVEVLKVPDTRATGTVSGDFPIRIEGAKVLLNNARLFADGAGGKIAYQGKALEPFTATEPSTKLAFSALRDFEFSVLEVSLNGDLAGRTQIRLELAGRNAQEIAVDNRTTLGKGQPFEFSLGFDGSLPHILDLVAQKQVVKLAIEQVEAEAKEKAEAEKAAAAPE